MVSAKGMITKSLVKNDETTLEQVRSAIDKDNKFL